MGRTKRGRRPLRQYPRRSARHRARTGRRSNSRRRRCPRSRPRPGRAPAPAIASSRRRSAARSDFSRASSPNISSRGWPRNFLPKTSATKRVVAKLDQLPAKADLEVRNAHHRRDQDHRRPRLAVAAADEHVLELLALEFERDRAFLAHAISSASSASFATVFMLRAVPLAAAGMRSFERPCPLG